MNYTQDLLANRTESERGVFYQKTYLHVALAIFLFMVVESFFLQSDIIRSFVFKVAETSWLLLLGGFYLITILGNRMAMSLTKPQQYLGLGLYIFAYAIIFLPILAIASSMSGGGQIIMQAAIVTLGLFTGLTAFAMSGKRDFSFLRGALIIGGFVAIGLIIAGSLFGFNLGLWFSVAMILLSGGSILYQTSQLRYRYGTEQYVAAAVGLFGSIMTMFYYILRIFMSRD